MGVVFFIYNAAFSTILLVIVIIASVIAVSAKNPDTRYQPMRDDRGSFIKSQSQLTTELDALGATARGETKHGYSSNKSGSRFEDDEDDSWSGNSSGRPPVQHQTSYTGSNRLSNGAGYASDRSTAGQMPPTYTPQETTASPYAPSHTNSMASSQHRFRQQGAGSPSPWQRGAGYE